VARTIINIGTHEAVLNSFAAALHGAGYLVRSALTVKELEKYLQLRECSALLVGHSLAPAEKDRAITMVKQWDDHCP
jgi:hypothetical protein